MVNQQQSPIERAELTRLAGSTALLALNLLVWLFALSDGAWLLFGYSTFVCIGLGWIVACDVAIVRQRHQN